MTSSIFEITSRYPDLRLSNISELNIKTFLLAKDILSNPLYHKCCLLAGVDEKVAVDNNFDQDLKKSLGVINRIISNDLEILLNPHDYQNEKIVYLCLLNTALDNSSHNIVKERAMYGLKLLKTIKVSKIIDSLTDKLFAIYDPDNYRKLENLLMEKSLLNISLKNIAIKSFGNLAVKKNINIKIAGRVKSLYSISRKLKNKGLLLAQILDMVGIRIITEKEEDCFKILDSIIAEYPILNNKLKDYISLPKANSYKSIHATIIFKNYPVEVQIRTKDMHIFAEYGHAAHSKYKNNNYKKMIL